MANLGHLLADVDLPTLFQVTQSFTPPCIAAVASHVHKALDTFGLESSIPKGGTVAIAVGSRGIAELPLIVRAVVAWWQDKGTHPFIVPAMGSHGQACAEGQLQVLAHLGITEASAGCPIHSCMDVVEVGQVDTVPVCIDKLAFQADGIFLINRVKPHTGFSGPHESGLVKMLVIGLGKQRGAEACHRLGYQYFPTLMPAMARILLAKAPILGALGIVENTLEQPCQIEVADKNTLLELDAKLLADAAKKMARLPIVTELDVLLVQQMGKEISGGGMDSNVTGRPASQWKRSELAVSKVGVLRLTPASEGNATGIGGADVISRELFEAVNLESTYTNVITSTILRAAVLPVIMDTDEQVVRCLLKTCNAHTAPRVVYIRDTLTLDRFWASSTVAHEIEQAGAGSVNWQPVPFHFDARGRLCSPVF